jgi:hypothetical protein
MTKWQVGKESHHFMNDGEKHSLQRLTFCVGKLFYKKNYLAE